MEVPPPPPMGLKWDSATLSDGIVNVDDTKAAIRKKTKDALDTKLPLHGTDDFDVILMIHLLCLLPTGSEVWQAVNTCIIAPK